MSNESRPGGAGGDRHRPATARRSGRRGPGRLHAGGHRGARSGKSFKLDGAAAVARARRPEPGLQIRLADRQVSRRHAALELHQRRLRVTDLGSTNGTFVDGVVVVDGYLRGGEIVRLGETRVPRRSPRRRRGRRPPLARPRRASAASSARAPRCAASTRSASASRSRRVAGRHRGRDRHRQGGARRGAPRDGPARGRAVRRLRLHRGRRRTWSSPSSSATSAARSPARSPRARGVFEQAHGGTLLIDEIGDLELALQPKLLRAHRALRGAPRRRRPARSRSTCACSPPRAAISIARSQAGRFRDDLFYRLAVARIELPPLRRRRGDVAALARHFWDAAGGDPARAHRRAALARWEDYAWPGNVRELRNAVARRLALGDLAPRRRRGEASPHVPQRAGGRAARPIDGVVLDARPPARRGPPARRRRVRAPLHRARARRARRQRRPARRRPRGWPGATSRSCERSARAEGAGARHARRPRGRTAPGCDPADRTRSGGSHGDGAPCDRRDRSPCGAAMGTRAAAGHVRCSGAGRDRRLARGAPARPHGGGSS